MLHRTATRATDEALREAPTTIDPGTDRLRRSTELERRAPEPGGTTGARMVTHNPTGPTQGSLSAVTRRSADFERAAERADQLVLAHGVTVQGVMPKQVGNLLIGDRLPILVRAPGRCENAMVAMAARALLDDRVRRTARAQ